MNRSKHIADEISDIVAEAIARIYINISRADAISVVKYHDDIATANYLHRRNTRERLT